jgi:hypothetical protein
MLLLIMLLTGPAIAQTIPANTVVSTPALIPEPFTADDTLRAVHNLFRSRRIGGAIMGPPAIAADLIAAQIDRSNTPANSFFKPSYGETMLIYGVFAGPFIAVGMHKLIYFSKARETKVMNEFKRSHKLPRKVKKELKPRFFIKQKHK